MAEAARNVVCSGAKPMAITNCLNFGNPYKPEVYWTFKEALAGMGDACRTFNTPVTGGNVSFYNENPKAAVFPTPVIGMLGLIEDLENHRMTPSFKQEGDVVYYIGAERSGLGGTEYLSTLFDLTTGDTPDIDLEFEANLQEALLEGIRQGLIQSAHDLSDGGLAVTLAEKAIFSGIGATLDVSELGSNHHEVLYSEAQSGVVVTVSKEQENALKNHFSKAGIPAFKLGTTGGSDLVIEDLLSLAVAELSEIYEGVIPSAMQLPV